MNHVNETLPTLFGGTLSLSTVAGDSKRNGWKLYEHRPETKEVKEKKKPGPKARTKPVGEFDAWNNKRVAFPFC